MKFEFKFDVYLHFVAPPSDPALALITHQGKKIMTILENLAKEVAETKAVNQSAVTLLQGLSAKLAEAIASGDLSAVQALADELDASTNELAAAVQANTPVVADPAPTE